ncbi:2Fe-2S iron-sulfur cluster-binding protein [Dethiobacter alkaliphilus]|uniref:Succinate dehydrogenase and fumarate reductase iron-sulfur protein n=1 Tax=Dethiobacter alkaliphilus AHT 1 TaxID=555088 RepID=C0GJK6_DETAL|nr:2Fe-2S iron-sulfur cluster-binding protein [Dethiobacter alkaliphilus]EEG76428.1 succinate dehydrogenase and fumarate reductase iron-sulfur protein [Dethiobacter alkaliphilus AHT 1]
MKTIRINQYVPERKDLVQTEYQVPNSPGATVLQALQYIYEELDGSLAFRYGCRYNHCGLCGVMVDGKPRLACKVKLDSVSEISPLTGLPLLRSLVVDRSGYMKKLQDLALYPQGGAVEPLGELQEDSLHKNLMKCLECLCCVSSCSQHTEGDNSSVDPYVFVKLAQLHLDPRDETDRQAQARANGIDKCADCGKCSCPNGIPIKKAILSLKGNKTVAEEVE